MPIILRLDDYELWLADDAKKQDLRKELLRLYPASEMTAYPVGAAINSSQHQGEELLQAIQ